MVSIVLTIKHVLSYRSFLSEVLLYIFQVKTLITEDSKKRITGCSGAMNSSSINLSLSGDGDGFAFASCVFIPILSVTLGLSFI